VLEIDDYPRLFEKLIKGQEIVINDATADPLTARLHKIYLGPLGCASLLAIPVLPGGMLAGAIWFEHEETIRAWRTEDISFARAIASLLELRLSASGIHDDVGASAKNGLTRGVVKASTSGAKFAAIPSGVEKIDSSQPVPAKQAGESPEGTVRKASFLDRMLERGLVQSSIKADVFPDVTVLVLHFTDPFALAEHFGKDVSTTAVDHLVCHFENLFDAHSIDLWRIMSDRILCAAGMQKNSNHPVDSIADLALSFQDKCSHLFADLDKPMEFKIGIDRGGVIGSHVGQRHKSYNIWGEAVSAASNMADNGVAGGIQVSQAAYWRLQKNYLFKVRGRFYLKNIGEITTYLLTGRL
jgi:class 3 adenylate cyclase